MASAILDDIAGKLASSGVSATIGRTTQFVAPQDASSVVLTETGGVDPEFTQQSAAVRRPGVQVLCRATTAAAARALGEQCYLAVGNLRNTTLGSNFYRAIVAVQEPIDLGRDDRGLWRCAVNLRTEVSKRA